MVNNGEREREREPGHAEDEEWKGGRPGRHTSGSLDMSRECTGVTGKTVQLKRWNVDDAY